MDDVIETLMKACGALGVIPKKRFANVHDFEAMILDLYGAHDLAAKKQQLAWILKAVQEAEAHRVGGVVACIRQTEELG